MKILLIEDTPLYAKLAKLLLAELGCDVTVATSGDDGVRLAREILPDLILSDLNLPGMSGFDAVAALRGDQRTVGIRTIAMTAKKLFDEDEREAKSAGFDGCVEKPHNIAGFREVLSRYAGD